MVASGLRTMIAGSLSSCIAGFHQSCRFSRSSGPRRVLNRPAPVKPRSCRYGLSEDHIATTPHDINRFRIAALSLDDYAAGLAYMTGLAHDAGQSAYDLFKNYPQSPT